MRDRFNMRSGVSGKNFRYSETHLGTVHDQTFYAIRHCPGRDLSIPFEQGHFNALLHMEREPANEIMQTVALQLLQHGLRAAVLSGKGADRMRDVMDALVDEHGFEQEGRTVYASAHEDEELEEVVDYFILPNGLADLSLIVVFGDDTAYHELVDTFETVTSGAEAAEAYELVALC